MRKLGEVWKEGRYNRDGCWKVQFPKGIMTYQTKKTATIVSAALQKEENELPDEIIMHKSEGVMSSTLDLTIDEKPVGMSNEKESWLKLKDWLDRGTKITVHYSKYNGKIQKYNWKGCQSYEYRFGVNGKYQQ